MAFRSSLASAAPAFVHCFSQRYALLESTNKRSRRLTPARGCGLRVGGETLSSNDASRPHKRAWRRNAGLRFAVSHELRGLVRLVDNHVVES
jgi:hypothetical protein